MREVVGWREENTRTNKPHHIDRSSVKQRESGRARQKSGEIKSET